MLNFMFYNPARIVFGKGVEAQTGELVRANGGSKVLLHYGGGSVKRNGVLDKVKASLQAAKATAAIATRNRFFFILTNTFKLINRFISVCLSVS